MCTGRSVYCSSLKRFQEVGSVTNRIMYQAAWYLKSLLLSQLTCLQSTYALSHFTQNYMIGNVFPLYPNLWNNSPCLVFPNLLNSDHYNYGMLLSADFISEKCLSLKRSTSWPCTLFKAYTIFYSCNINVTTDIMKPICQPIQLWMANLKSGHCWKSCKSTGMLMNDRQLGKFRHIATVPLTIVNLPVLISHDPYLLHFDR